jgi:hypothetical protein
VETRAIRIDTGQLDALPRPFIAFLARGSSRFITVTHIDDGAVEYLDDRYQKRSLPRGDFLYAWEGVALLASAGQNSGEPEFRRKKRLEWRRDMGLPGALLLFLLFGVIRFLAGGQADTFQSVYPAALLLAKSLGVIVTSLLLWYEYDGNQTLLQQICTLGKKTSCKAILQSRASKLPGGISWSEVGFVYFAGSFVALTIAGAAALPWLYFLNLLALPYTGFSLYYQGVVARQWCVLCLLVQLLLVAEFLSALFTHTGPALQWHALTGQSIGSSLTVAASFAAMAYLWLLAKPWLYEGRQAKEYLHQLNRLKRNAEVFNATLKEQPPLQPGTEGMGILIGNPEAPNTLLKICNPYCGPCAKAHPKIESLIKSNPEWKAQIIFAVHVHENDLRTTTAAHLLAVAGNDRLGAGGRAREDAIHEWYKEGSDNLLQPEERYRAWAERYPVNGELSRQELKVQEMTEWCERAGITHTPTIYVNGHLLPDQYEIKDLEYL